MTDFHYQALFEHSGDETSYRRLDGAWVSLDRFQGAEVLVVD